MSVTTAPIRSKIDLLRLTSCYYNRSELRSYTLVSLGPNTALHISHLLSRRWDDVYDFKYNSFRLHVTVSERKIKKTFRLNKSALKAQKNLHFLSHRGRQKGILLPQTVRMGQRKGLAHGYLSRRIEHIYSNPPKSPHIRLSGMAQCRRSLCLNLWIAIVSKVRDPCAEALIFLLQCLFFSCNFGSFVLSCG